MIKITMSTVCSTRCFTFEIDKFSKSIILMGGAYYLLPQISTFLNDLDGLRTKMQLKRIFAEKINDACIFMSALIKSSSLHDFMRNIDRRHIPADFYSDYENRCNHTNL